MAKRYCDRCRKPFKPEWSRQPFCKACGEIVGKEITKPLAVAALCGLVTRIARCKIDGELHDLGDGHPEEFVEENDDALETLHRFVREARELTGEKPETLIEED